MAWTLKIKGKPDGWTTSEHNIFTSTVCEYMTTAPPPVPPHQTKKRTKKNLNQ